MIIQLKHHIDSSTKERIAQFVQSLDYTVSEVSTQKGNYFVGIGKKEIDIRHIGSLEGVADVYRVSENYKLVSRKWKQQTSAIELGPGVLIGGPEPVLMAGPCAIESEDQVRAVVDHLKQQGIRVMRGGVFKPRSSPYTFQGLGIEGLRMFHRVCKEAGIYLITEVMEIAQIEQMYDYVDVFQVGARNTQNFNLLNALGKTDKPVLLKRGISGTIDELLQSAEYVFSAGNEQLMLCERGIRSFESAYRNTFDINAIPLLKEKTHLPVIADPSHGIGIRSHVAAVALAAAAAGADGIIYEVHAQPERALSDAQQTLNFEESAALVAQLKRLAAVLK
ncbi:3-deoxy-7-phosphoheptulonate synthase [Taibaiella sp. KBW10]|uniref:bifunctional 3-deoxy-7-phosphoheptulonate synthase/chorismate mutase n=1 Tax=Taibaiella sp. KBW10 TaxID=2153357 RepID=UPI000F591871|nr:bifunctional 3-deoxy-7-phosphoheptulonate synthase/chorismate mutase [Taibaiella sp. KBW10]RQO29814.1 3-deoxy-7-phosphoheptulonate synthase [Taibaiella sp. KBW10]